jgi:hypothetical protein
MCSSDVEAGAVDTPVVRRRQSAVKNSADLDCLQGAVPLGDRSGRLGFSAAAGRLEKFPTVRFSGLL